MPFGNLKPLTPRVSAKDINQTKLMNRFGFDAQQAKDVLEVFQSDAMKVRSLCSISLHIKALGFKREDIVSLIQLMKEDSLDLGNWEGLKNLPAKMKSPEMAYLAYMAGLRESDIDHMSEEELSMESLKIMASLRNF